MNRYSLFLAMIMLLFSVSLSYSGDNVSLYLKASELEEAGKYEEAAAIIEKIAKKDQSVYLYQRLSSLYIISGNNNKAILCLSEAEKLFPEEAYFKFTLGKIYEFTKKDTAKAYNYYSEAAKLSSDLSYHMAAVRTAEAEKKYKEALDLLNGFIKENPDSLYYAERGKIYLVMGKRDKAVADFKTAIEKDENMPAMLRLADVYLAENNLEEAKKILEKITSKDQSLIVPELALGEIYKDEKDYARAIEVYSVAADKLEGKDRAAVLRQLGTIQYESGDYDNASKTFEWVTELTPEDSMSAYFSGYMYEYLGNTEKAKEIYKRALKVHPTYAQLLERMAVISLLDNDGDKALEYINRIDLVERDVDYYLIASEVYSRQGNHNKAVLILISGLEENPTDMEILYSLAMQYEYLNERNNTLDILKKALATDPENPVFQNFLGYIYADMGINLEESFELISKALEKDPENLAYIDSMAWVLFKMKDYQKAYKYIKKAYEKMPEDKEIAEHYKAIKEKVGE